MTKETLNTVKKVLNGEWHLCRGEKIRFYNQLNCSSCRRGDYTSIIEMASSIDSLYELDMMINKKICTLEEYKITIEKILKERMDKEWTKT